MSIIKQYRYYGYNSNENQQNITLEELKNDVLKKDNIQNVIKLGIQTMPGIKFYLNSEINKSAEESIIINNTGIFDLEIPYDTMISSLRFDESVDQIKTTNNSNYKYLIIDIVAN